MKPGLKLPYPSGSKWRVLNGEVEANESRVIRLGEERLTEALVDDGREFAKAFSALIINDDEEALMNEGDGNSNELHANASTLTYKDLKGIMRARKKKEARLGKAVGSGEEPPPKDLKEALNHPTRVAKNSKKSDSSWKPGLEIEREMSKNNRNVFL